MVALLISCIVCGSFRKLSRHSHILNKQRDNQYVEAADPIKRTRSTMGVENKLEALIDSKRINHV